MLNNSCRTWPDPLAAAVYIPTVQGSIASQEDPTLEGQPLAAAVQRLADFHARMEAEGGLPARRPATFLALEHSMALSLCSALFVRRAHAGAICSPAFSRPACSCSARAGVVVSE